MTRARRILRSLATPSMAVALVALLVALSGVALAAAGTIGSFQIADESIQSRDVRNGSLGRSDFRAESMDSYRIRNGTIRSADVDSDDFPWLHADRHMDVGDPAVELLSHGAISIVGTCAGTVADPRVTGTMDFAIGGSWAGILVSPRLATPNHVVTIEGSGGSLSALLDASGGAYREFIGTLRAGDDVAAIELRIHATANDGCLLMASLRPLPSST